PAARGPAGNGSPYRLSALASVARAGPRARLPENILNREERDMAYKTLIVEKEGAVDRVTLNRPDALNAMKPELVGELQDYFGKLYTDHPVRIVVLKGAGRAFCAGLDLKERSNRPEADTSGSPQAGLVSQRRISEIVMRMRRCPQAIISLIHGPACGGGFALALASDIRIAGESARMNAAFIRI